MITFQIIHLYLNELMCNSYLNQSKLNSYLGAFALSLITFLWLAAFWFGGQQALLGMQSPKRTELEKSHGSAPFATSPSIIC